MSIALNLDHTRQCRARHAPRRPSLVGLSKPKMADAVRSGIGLEEREARMRASQLWNWIYHHGVTDFERMSNIAEGGSGRRWPIASCSTGPRSSPSRFRSTARANGCSAIATPRIPNLPPVEIETVYIPEDDRGTLCVSSQVGCTLTCSFCHTGTQTAGAQSDRGRNSRPDPDGARTAGRFSRRRPPRRWRAGAGAARVGRVGRRQPGHHQCGDDGHGRAALQLRSGQERAADRVGRGWHFAQQAPHHALDLGRGAARSSRPAARSASCWRSRCMPCATICATCWCRSTRSGR